MKDFANTPMGLYQEEACGILASLSLLVEADQRMQRMKFRGDSLRWIYQSEMKHHFTRAVFDTLQLLEHLTHGGGIATNANLENLCKNGYSAFINIMDANESKLDLES